jgi:hypothetical protein
LKEVRILLIIYNIISQSQNSVLQNGTLKGGVPFLKSKKKSPKRFLSDNKNALGHFYYKKTL